jgi:hypothetical protein
MPARIAEPGGHLVERPNARPALAEDLVRAHGRLLEIYEARTLATRPPRRVRRGCPGFGLLAPAASRPALGTGLSGRAVLLRGASERE